VQPSAPAPEARRETREGEIGRAAVALLAARAVRHERRGQGGDKHVGQPVSLRVHHVSADTRS
jgi:hypothetical protein